MKKIPSFTVDHIKLQKGVYTSRIDRVGNLPVTTYDIRMKRPNLEPVMGTAEMHAMEHLGATFLRNHETLADHVIYFGPMGCRTGFYILLKGDLAPKEVVPYLIDMFQFIVDFTGEIPGAAPKDCGNYQDMNLNMAQFEAKIFLETLQNITDDQLTYPN